MVRRVMTVHRPPAVKPGLPCPDRVALVPGAPPAYCSCMNKTTRTRSAEEQALDSLLHAAHAIQGEMEEALAGVGLSVAKHGVLKRLAEAGRALSLSELAALSSCVRSNITQLVDRLEQDGLVARVDDPGDRRSVRAQLTALGKERQRAGAARIRQVLARFSSRLSPSELALLNRVLPKVG